MILPFKIGRVDEFGAIDKMKLGVFTMRDLMRMLVMPVMKSSSELDGEVVRKTRPSYAESSEARSSSPPRGTRSCPSRG